MKNQSSNSKSIFAFLAVVILAFAAFYLGKSSPKLEKPIQEDSLSVKPSPKKLISSQAQHSDVAAHTSEELPIPPVTTEQREIPSDFKAQLDSLPPELPEDLKQQMMNPPTELPEDLKAQLNAAPPPIPEDIRRAMETPPRVVTEAEVNDPNWKPGQ